MLVLGDVIILLLKKVSLWMCFFSHPCIYFVLTLGKSKFFCVFCSLLLKVKLCYTALFGSFFFLWDVEGNSLETNISNLSCIASNLPAVAVHIQVFHRPKCCQLNNCFCLTYFQSFAHENPLIFIILGLLGHEFSVCVF